MCLHESSSLDGAVRERDASKGEGERGKKEKDEEMPMEHEVKSRTGRWY